VGDFDAEAGLTNGTPTPLAGFHVKTCFVLGAVSAQQFGLDFCAKPLDDQISDPDGNVVIDLSKNGLNISHYFEVTPPPGFAYQTHLFFLPGWTLTHSTTADFTIYLPTSLGNIPPSDPGLGGVLFFTRDCSWILTRAAGVEVSARPAGSATQYATEGLVPSESATATDSRATGFITNLPPGQVMLSTWRHDTGERIGDTPIVIQAGALTVAELVPTP